jgi:membrane protease YdiL (CAAX protease family)
VRSVFKFFSITYLVSWTCWIAAVVIHEPGQAQTSVLGSVLLVLGTFAPALVALAITAHSTGKTGLTSMLSHLFQANVEFRWYLFAILYMPIIKGAVALSHLLATGRWPPFGHEGPIVIVVAIILSTPVQAGEELGWRGYALPRIAARFGLGPASVVVGLLWGIWHLPLFFLPGADKFGQSFPLYVVGVVAFSVAITWLYGHTQGSLLLTMLMHSAFNQTIGLVSDVLRPGEKPFLLGSSLSFLLTVASMWTGAMYFLARMPAFPSIAKPLGPGSGLPADDSFGKQHLRMAASQTFLSELQFREARECSPPSVASCWSAKITAGV